MAETSLAGKEDTAMRMPKADNNNLRAADSLFHPLHEFKLGAPSREENGNLVPLKKGAASEWTQPGHIAGQAACELAPSSTPPNNY